MHFIVIQRHPQAAGLGQKFMQELEARPHHGAPFVMAEHVFAVDRIAGQPFAHDGAVHIVVVAPVFVAGVVGRVDENAVHLAGVAGQQGFQGMKIIAVDNEVAVQIPVADGFVRLWHQRPKGDGQMMVVDEFFALEEKLHDDLC